MSCHLRLSQYTPLDARKLHLLQFVQNILKDNPSQNICTSKVRFILKYPNKTAVYRLGLYRGFQLFDNARQVGRMNCRTHIAWLLPSTALALIFSGFVSSGQQSGNGKYNQKYPAKGGGFGKSVGKSKGNPPGANKGGSKGGSSGGTVPGVSRPTITLSIVRLRLRSFRTSQSRRLPPSRPAMSAISGVRFQRAASTSKTGGGQSSAKGNSGQGKSNP